MNWFEDCCSRFSPIIRHSLVLLINYQHFEKTFWFRIYSQDYLKYAESELDLKPLKRSYFRDAMDYFREEYGQVVFLWVSDDMEWAKKNIKNKDRDIYFVGKRKINIRIS